MGGGWWVQDALSMPNGRVVLVSWVVWVIGSIVLHELAHGWAALRSGDPTPREAGHMTWNPLVHMGGLSLLMFAIVGIAWGAMPVNPSRFRGRYDDAKVAAAGPAMNFALFVLCVVCGAVWAVFVRGAVGDPVGPNVFTFFYIGAAMNLALMVFNLLPVPPLDGSRVLANFSPWYAQVINTERGAIVSLVAFMLLFLFVGGKIFGMAFAGAGESIVALGGVLRGGGGPAGP